MYIDRLADDVVYRLMEKVACDAELQQMLKEAGFLGDIGNWAKKNVLAPAAVAGSIMMSPTPAVNVAANGTSMYRNTAPAIQQMIKNPTQTNVNNAIAQGKQNGYIHDLKSYVNNHDKIIADYKKSGGFDNGLGAVLEPAFSQAAIVRHNSLGSPATSYAVNSIERSADGGIKPKSLKPVGAGFVTYNDKAIPKFFPEKGSQPAVLGHEMAESYFQDKGNNITLRENGINPYTNYGYNHQDTGVLLNDNNMAYYNKDFKNDITKIRAMTGELEPMARTVGNYDKGWLYDDNFRIGDKLVNSEDPKLRTQLRDNLESNYNELGAIKGTQDKADRIKNEAIDRENDRIAQEEKNKSWDGVKERLRDSKYDDSLNYYSLTQSGNASSEKSYDNYYKAKSGVDNVDINSDMPTFTKNLRDHFKALNQAANPNNARIKSSPFIFKKSPYTEASNKGYIG